MTPAVRTRPAPDPPAVTAGAAGPTAPHTPVSAVTRSPVWAWLAPRLAGGAPVPPGQVRLVGIVVNDPSFADPDSAARVAWIGDGACPQQVMARHAADLDRYDVVIGLAWYEHGPEPLVMLVNP